MKSHCPYSLKKQFVAVSVELIVVPFGESTEEGKMNGLFMQDSATAHTFEFTVTTLEEVFNEQLITQRLWSTSGDVNL
jgi:hypothetical protein